jgi:hypothetical protein
MVRSRETQQYFLSQTQTQIGIGLEVAGLAKEEYEIDDESDERSVGPIKDLIKVTLQPRSTRRP